MTSINISLDVNEIIYDIQNKTYLTGKSRHDGSNHEQVANMQANDDEENANQVVRSISMAFANLKNKLGEYLSLPAVQGTNETIDPAKALMLPLKMPSNYNCATVDTIASAAHQYIVSSAVAEWFAITNKADSSQYSAMADTCLSIISEAASRRVRPQRPA